MTATQTPPVPRPQALHSNASAGRKTVTMATAPTVLVSVDLFAVFFFSSHCWRCQVILIFFFAAGCPVNRCENGGTCIISEIGNICK